MTKNKMKPLLILFFGEFIAMHAWAEFDPNRLAQEQQAVDKTVRHENRINKTDVYSKIEAFKINEIEYPVEENCFKFDQLVIENNFLHDRNINRIKADVVGQCLGEKGIAKLARVLQDYFIHSGYITTRVEIPDQDLTSKQLKLMVIPGRIAQIVIAHQAVSPKVLPFKVQDILNVRDVEQGLETLQRIPNANVKIDIVPSQDSGYSDLAIKMNPVKNWGMRTWINNWGSEGTGRNLWGGALYLYDITKTNDIFYVSGSTDIEEGDRGYRNFSAYYSIPYQYWDYELFYSQSKTQQPITSAGSKFNYYGNIDYTSFKASRLVYRDADKKITVSGELFKRKVRNKFETIDLTLQRRDMLNARFSVNLKKNSPGAFLDTTISYQQFLPWFGAEQTPDMKSGDVSKRSSIINFDLNYIQFTKLAKYDGYYNFKFGAQYAPQSLTLQDRFTVGDRWNVRGFESKAGLIGDNGFYSQNTINLITGVKNIEFFVGADYGLIFKDEINPRNGHLLGSTVGLKGNYKHLDYSFSISKPLDYPRGFNPDDVTFNFNLSYQL